MVSSHNDYKSSSLTLNYYLAIHLNTCNLIPLPACMHLFAQRMTHVTQDAFQTQLVLISLHKK